MRKTNRARVSSIRRITINILGNVVIHNVCRYPDRSLSNISDIGKQIFGGHRMTKRKDQESRHLRCDRAELGLLKTITWLRCMAISTSRTGKSRSHGMYPKQKVLQNMVMGNRWPAQKDSRPKEWGRVDQTCQVLTYDGHPEPPWACEISQVSKVLGHPLQPGME